ncbi:MAG: sterol desaturase family protein, partial [Bacteroidota bacterium]
MHLMKFPKKSIAMQQTVNHSVAEMGFAAHLRYHWMENIVYRTLEYIPLALLGIGLYDFFIIHLFTLTVGHYNHSNISVSGKVTGGILGGLIGIVMATGAFELTILQTAILWQQLIIILGGVGIGVIAFGPFMKILFNHPEMHIWHHAYEMPDSHPRGINFGLTLAVWDYIFKTVHMPKSGRDIKLGFPGVEEFPDNFVSQNLHGFSKK